MYTRSINWWFGDWFYESVVSNFAPQPEGTTRTKSVFQYNWPNWFVLYFQSYWSSKLFLNVVWNIPYSRKDLHKKKSVFQYNWPKRFCLYQVEGSKYCYISYLIQFQILLHTWKELHEQNRFSNTIGQIILVQTILNQDPNNCQIDFQISPHIRKSIKRKFSNTSSIMLVVVSY